MLHQSSTAIQRRPADSWWRSRCATCAGQSWTSRSPSCGQLWSPCAIAVGSRRRWCWCSWPTACVCCSCIAFTNFASAIEKKRKDWNVLRLFELIMYTEQPKGEVYWASLWGCVIEMCMQHLLVFDAISWQPLQAWLEWVWGERLLVKLPGICCWWTLQFAM